MRKPDANSPLIVFGAEFSLLLLLSITFTYFVSDLAETSVDAVQACDLGPAGFVPYIAYNESRFCDIDQKAVVLAAAYFILVALVLTTCEILYRRSSFLVNVKYTTIHRISLMAVFWMAVIVWFFGLEGRRGDYEFLTQSMYVKSGILSLLSSLSQLLMAIGRQSRKA